MKKFGFLFFLMLTPWIIWAQNDDPCSAIPLTADTLCSFQLVNNIGTTNTAGVPIPSCGGTDPGEEDIWFTVTVPASGNVIINTDTGSLQNIAMAIYSASSCSGPLTEISCDENSAGNNMPQITLLGQTPGAVLYLRVWDIFEPGFFGIGADPRDQGDFKICFVAPPPTPFNDEPCQAITLVPGSSCNPTVGTNVDALSTQNIPDPGCGGTNPGLEDVWYVLQVPASGAITISMSAGTLNNMAMAAYTSTSCSNSLTLLDCNAGGIGMPSMTLQGLTPGQYIFVRVWDEYSAGFLGLGADPREQGTFNICAIETVPLGGGGSGNTGSYSCGSTPAAGNTCSAATPICTFDGYCGSTAGYTDEYWFNGSQGLGGPLNANGIFCGSIENNSFISFVASSSVVDLDVIVSGTSTACDDGVQFMMFGDPTGAPACGSLNIVDYGCESPMAPGTNNFQATGLTPGAQYYLMVDGFAGDVCDYQINAISGVLVGVSVGADRNICLGESVDLTVYGAGTGTVTWTGPFLSSTAGTSVTATPTATGSYQYIVTAPNIDPSCGGPSSQDTVVITVGNASTINVTAGACVNGEVTLTATGGTSYTWDPPTDIGQTSGAIVTVSPTTATTYTVYGASASGCVLSDTITVGAAGAATINPATFCATDAASTLTAVGIQGGTWSGAGITNTTTGLFDPSVAGVGNHSITYLTGGSCGGTAIETISVTAAANPSISPANFCISAVASNLVVTGASGGIWSGSGIIDGVNGTFDPSVAGVGNHSITYLTGGSCGGVDTETITVTAGDQASINTAAFCLAEPATNLTVIGTQGGSWTGTGITNGTSGTFDPSTSGVGTHQVIYSTSGVCATADTIDIVVSNTLNATINSQSFCASDVAMNLSVTGSTGGTWSGSGIIDVNNGTFDPSIGAGSYQVIYALSGSCGSADTTDIVVNANDQASINNAIFCLAEPATNLTVIGTQGGSWTGTGITNGTSGTFDPSTSGVGTHQVIYSTSGVCATADTIDVVVSANALADIQEDTICEGSTDLNLTVTGTTGGSWSGTGITDVVNGTFDPSVSGTGSFEVIYSVSGACPVADTALIQVEEEDQAVIDQESFCLADAATNLTVTGTQGGSWTGTGISNPITGLFDPSIAGVGSHDIIYTTNGICADTDTLAINVTALGQASIQPQDLCPNTAALDLGLTGTTGGTWSGSGITDAVNGTFDPSVSGSGTFTVYYSTTGACAASDSAIIIVAEDPSVDPYINQQGNVVDSILLGNTANLFSGTNVGNLTYNWVEISGTGSSNLDDPSSSQPIFNPDTEGTYIYQLVGSSSGGTANCVDSGQLRLVVYSDASEPQIPTAFTPNGDEVNEVFQVIGLDAEYLLEFKVFNRWGVVVYDDTNGQWDGSYKDKDQPSDAYIYLISWKQPSDTEPVVLRGQLTLLR